MEAAELRGHAGERISLRLLRTVVEELSVELKRGSFQPQCCDTIYSLSRSLSAAASEAGLPPAAASDSQLRSLTPCLVGAKMEPSFLDQLRDDSPRGQQGLLSAFKELEVTHMSAVRAISTPEVFQPSFVSKMPVTKVSSQESNLSSSKKKKMSMRNSAMHVGAMRNSLQCSAGRANNFEISISHVQSSYESAMNFRSSDENSRSRGSRRTSYDSDLRTLVDMPLTEEDEDSEPSDAEDMPSLLKLFQALDRDCSGSLDVEELRAALVAAGISKARTQKMMFAADLDGNGEIDYDEWKAACASGYDREMRLFTAHLKKLQLQRKSIFHSDNVDKLISPCMMRPDSYVRLLWDCGLALLCIYVAFVIPFTSGFSHWIRDEDLVVAEQLELALDVFFLIDVCLNFRTGIIRKEGLVDMNWRSVAVSYLSSWFALDLASSIPFSELSSGSVGSVRVLKLLKIPKLVKAIRVIKQMVLAQSQIIVILDEQFSTPFLRAVFRRGTMFLLTVLLCHWLACLMAFTSTDWLSKHLASHNQMERVWSIYITALYWAMTTMTTVGWGDLTASNDAERGYVIFAMVVGGAYYGYAVGTLAAIVHSKDLNASAYHARMDAIYAWLDHHKLPPEMRQRIIRYFKMYLSTKAAATEADVVNELSPALRHEVGELIVHADILNNPLFDNVPMNAVTRLQGVVDAIHMDEGCVVVRAGEAGVAMFIINEGMAKQEFEETDGKTASRTGMLAKGDSFGEEFEETDGKTARRTRMLAEGDSFGEEILCSLTDKYCYTVSVIKKRACMFIIEEVHFKELFEHMPEVLAQLVRNAKELQHVVVAN